MRSIPTLLAVPVIALAFGSPPALAAPTTWDFSISHMVSFIDGVTTGSEFTLGGSFTGEDLNHDGIIGRGELTFFKIGLFQILPATGFFTDCFHDGMECMTWSVMPMFSYSPALGTFQVSGWEGGKPSQSVDIFFPPRFEQMAPGVRLREVDGSHVMESRETAATTLTVTPAVPEPGSTALLALGLASLVGVVRRKRQR